MTSSVPVPVKCHKNLLQKRIAQYVIGHDSDTNAKLWMQIRPTLTSVAIIKSLSSTHLSLPSLITLSLIVEMPSNFQSRGARTNTVGGKNVVLRQMTQHYQALADMKPQIDTTEPITRVRHNKVKQSPMRRRRRSNKAINSPLGYKRAPKPKDILTKTKTAVHRIRTGAGTLNQTHSGSDLREKLVERRIRREHRERKEHQKTLDKISNAILDLDHQSVHDRKYNRFDPIAYPVTLLRRDSAHNTPMPCLSDSSKNLGRLTCVTDTATRDTLSRQYSHRHSAESKIRALNAMHGPTAPLSSRRHYRAKSCPSTPIRPQSAKMNSRAKSVSKLNTKPKRPQSAIHNRRRSGGGRLKKDHYPNYIESQNFNFSENEPMAMNTRTDESNTGSMHPQSLHLKNRIMAQIIKHKIFSEETLIAFFKSTLTQYGPEDDNLISIIGELCHEFHVPFQKVMVNTDPESTCSTLR